MAAARFTLILFVANLMIGPATKWSIYSRLISDESGDDYRRITILGIISSLAIAVMFVPMALLWTVGMNGVASVFMGENSSPSGLTEEILLGVGIIGVFATALAVVPGLGALLERYVLVRKWGKTVTRSDLVSLWGWNVLIVICASLIAGAID